MTFMRNSWLACNVTALPSVGAFAFVSGRGASSASGSLCWAEWCVRDELSCAGVYLRVSNHVGLTVCAIHN
jgi:hypothetical protein